MSELPFRSIAAQLIRRLVLLTLLGLVLLLGLQAWLLQRQQAERLGGLLEEVAGASVPLLAIGLWDIEPAAVRAQVTLLAERPEIGYVRLQATGGQRFGAGRFELAARAADYRLTIHAPHGGMALGELELVSDPEFYWHGLWRTALPLLLGYAVLTGVVSLMIVLVLRRYLQHPLREMARFASELTPQQLMTPLQLDRPRQHHVDEIDLLAEGFGKLQAGLRDHIGSLDNLVLERTTQLEQLLAEIRELSMTDALTGTYNRRTIDERLPAELERAHRYDRPLALMFIDLDHFKQINDTHGHAVGDEVLRQVAGHIRAGLRQGVDWVARYGGEEFLVVLPETGLEAAAATAQRLRRDLLELRVQCPPAPTLAVTASFGVSACRPGEDSAALLARADALVYRAKAEGRDRIVVEP